ncbi:ribonuclease HII [Lentibacillus daqui]|uniref:ribonuclease HII n=1 Tax=Lentibacillus daqui TaxID=2911514 RepID=UPI0022B0ABD1|nr:ribonuclease HII [Lentibacillus daqui]
MSKQSIDELKQLFARNAVTETLLAELRLDTRKGVQQLIARHDRNKQKKQELKKRFVDMCRYEQFNYQNGCQYIAGIDEAGRGPLAGPVVAAAVILPHDFSLLGLNDSKQLNEATRERFFAQIKEQAVSYGIAMINNQIIDEINIFQATKQAMYEAIDQLNPAPDHVLVDAVQLGGLKCSAEAIVKGDQKSISIAAASILAKVTRDQLMKQIHTEFPCYDFASNMGYGTKHHMEMLQQHGISPYHRKSYAPVRNIAT